MRHRPIGLAIIAAFLLSPLLPVAAQPQADGSAPEGITLPGSTSQTCVQVEVAGQKPSAYNCLNQQLQLQAQAVSPQPNPLSANSPSNQVGTFNEQSVAEQYGRNFGKSVIPYRPPPPVFSNALGPAR